MRTRSAGTALKNERYSIVSEQEGWIQISGGYISADYVDVRYALNEARKLDLRTMVLICMTIWVFPMSITT